jgi:hypothetical protein
VETTTFLFSADGDNLLVNKSQCYAAKVTQETKKLYDAMVLLNPGNDLSWEEISTIAGVNCRPGQIGYPSLTKARQILIQVNGRYFEAVIGKGLRLLSQEEFAMGSGKFVKYIRTRAKRSAKTINSCVKDYEALTQDARTQTNLTRTYLQALILTTKPKAMLKIERVVRQTLNILPPKDLLLQFIKEDSAGRD